MQSRKSLNKLTMSTFEGVTLAPFFPEVIAISVPLGKDELEKLGRQKCQGKEKCKRDPIRQAGFEDDMLRKQKEAHHKGIFFAVVCLPGV